MTRPTTGAPGWTEQPARIPESLARPVFTPAARVRLREAVFERGHLEPRSANGVIRLRDVEQHIAATGSTTAAQGFASSVTTSVQLPRSTTPEWRLARAALAATRVLRQIDPTPGLVRFRLPSLGGDGRDLLLAAVEDLTEEAIVARLRVAPGPDASSGGADVALDLVDLTALGVDGVTLEARQCTVVVLGTPAAQLIPTAEASPTVAVVDTVRVTVATVSTTTLETSAAVLGAVKASLSRGGAP